MFSLRSVIGAVVVIAALAAAASAIAADSPVQQSGTAGCVTESGLAGECQDGRGLVGPRAIALSPDGENAYVVDEAWDSVATLTRDGGSGILSPISTPSGCLSMTPNYDACGEGRALGSARDVAVSPDGKNVYVAAPTEDAVAVLDRDAGDGHLTQSSGDDGCVSADGSGECGEGNALDEPTSVAVSPDGENVYVASKGPVGGIAIFERDPETGDLSQDPGTAGCVSDVIGGCVKGLTQMSGIETVEVSPDGGTLYGLSPSSDTITLFTRDAETGALKAVPAPDGCLVSKPAEGCTVANGLGDPRAIAFAGGNAYLASERRDAILVFDRDATSGKLTQKPGTAGCVSNTGLSDPMQNGTAGECVNGVAMDGISSVAALADGSELYATTKEAAGLVAFERAADGRVAQLSGTAGCTTEAGLEDPNLPWTEGTCADGRALLQANGIVASGDSRNVYATARLGGVAGFDLVPPSAPEPPAAALPPPPPAVSPACASAREKAGKVSSQLKTQSQENKRNALKALYAHPGPGRVKLKEAADRGRRKAKRLRAQLRKANAGVTLACV
jgi:DNA-binding beta-propeller fold protein YncE